uniref:Zinc finger, CCHC-type n=1 Tax=Tanacetum cinerariifolium TaxID=118510 RepID=A0A699H615_TANCI|nr:zinc finger, CCHC-type [Tanacetum cinerariifolium]
MPGNENKVCKLIKSFYGLKQAPKQWHQKFDEVVLSNGYLLNQADKCVYRKFDESGKGVIIFLYVDDMLIFGTDQVQVDLTKKFCHQVSTHMDTSEKLMPNNGDAISQLEYSRVIGCLMYAMTCTRPDIAFFVGKLSMYTSNPGTQHWKAIQRVLKYLKKTLDYKLTYTGYPLVLEGYTDASWISNTEDNSSTSGWVFLLGEEDTEIKVLDQNTAMRFHNSKKGYEIYSKRTLTQTWKPVETLIVLMTSAKPETTPSSIPAEGEKKKSNAYKQDKEPISPFIDDSPNAVNPSSFEGEFTRQLFGSKIKHYSVTRSPLPSNIDKDKGISFDESTTKDFVPFMEQSGSAQSVPQVIVFTKHGRPVFHSAEKAIQMLKEQNRMADIKAAEEADAKALDNTMLS